MMKAFQAVFEDGASPFVRWALTPFLILIMLFFAPMLLVVEDSGVGESFLVIAVLETTFLASLCVLHSLWKI